MVNGTLDRWDVCIAQTRTNSHNVRPIVVIEDKGDFVKGYFCGSDKVQKQKDGTYLAVSDFYRTHPRFEIKPISLVDWKECGLSSPTYVNVYELRSISKSDIDGTEKGRLSSRDIETLKQEVGLKESMKFILSEDLFLPEVELEEPIAVEETIPGPISGEASGVAEELMNLIKDELEAIQRYNGFIATITDLGGFEHMKETIEHINTEENKHIGELQALLKTISPNAEKIDDGQEEASNEMGVDMKVVSESINNFDNINNKVASVNPVTADAIEVSKKKRKELEKSAKDMGAKVTDQGAIVKDNDTKEPKKVKSDDLKKMHLEEDLFEDARPRKRLTESSAISVCEVRGKIKVDNKEDVKILNMSAIEDDLDEGHFEVDLDCNANFVDVVVDDCNDTITFKQTPIKITKVYIENDDYNLVNQPTEESIFDCLKDMEIIENFSIYDEQFDGKFLCENPDFDYDNGLVTNYNNLAEMTVREIEFELTNQEDIDSINHFLNTYKPKLSESKKISESIKDKFDAIQDELLDTHLSNNKRFEDSEIGAYFGENDEEGIKVTTNDPEKIEKLKEIAKKYNAPFKETDKKHYKDVSKKIGKDETGHNIYSHNLGSDDIHTFIIITNQVEEELLTTQQKLEQNTNKVAQQQNSQQNNNVQDAYNKAKQSNFTNKDDLAELEKQLGIEK